MQQNYQQGYQQSYQQGNQQGYQPAYQPPYQGQVSPNETIVSQRSVYPTMPIGDEGQSFLRTAGSWCLFLGIIGVISVVLLILIAIGMVVVGSSASSYMGYGYPYAAGAASATKTIMWISAALYFIIAIIYIYPISQMFSFNSKVKAATSSGDAATLTQSLRHMRNIFAFFGIMTIIGISLFILAIIVALLAS